MSKLFADNPTSSRKQCHVLFHSTREEPEQKFYRSFYVSYQSQCQKCKEGILNIQTCRKVDRLVGEHKARVDSKRIVAANLTEVSALTKLLHVSRQRVHQMMIAGQIPYVFIDQTRVPIKTAA